MKPIAAATPLKPIRNTPFFSLATLSVVCVVAVLTASIGANTAQADGHEADEAITKYRQSLMAGVGANMGALSGILKNGLNLPGHIESHAGQMAEEAGLIAAAFRKQTKTQATDAKPEIWTDWKGFESAIADYESAAKTLQAAAAAGDAGAVGKAMRGLGKSCGGCHKAYRTPKEESYKNR
ncbi:MAG: cytochrome c [Myxococcota bacterium]